MGKIFSATVFSGSKDFDPKDTSNLHFFYPTKPTWNAFIITLEEIKAVNNIDYDSFKTNSIFQMLIIYCFNLTRNKYFINKSKFQILIDV